MKFKIKSKKFSRRELLMKEVERVYESSQELYKTYCLLDNKKIIALESAQEALAK